MSARQSPFASLVHTLFPPACPVCRAETSAAGGLCPACWREMSFLAPGGCATCGRPLLGHAMPGEQCGDCLRHPPAWTSGAATFRYGGTGRRLVLAMKHGDRQDLIPMLGAWALRAGGDLIDRADLIAPVPLHWTRRLKRRGNHVAELTRWLCHASGRRHAPRLLIRQRNTGSQDGKNRAARVTNVAGSLVPGPGPDPRGRRVLLVDDVLTTGATLNAAARACRAMGAERVDILVLALVDRDEASYIAASTEEEIHEAS